MNATGLVLDASVALAWVFEDEYSPYAEGVFRALGTLEVWVPCLWPLEIANALLVAERRGRITPAKRQAFVEILEQLEILVLPPWPLLVLQTQVLPLAQEMNLSVYDATYLYTALLRGFPLATQDRRLQQAAQARGLWFQPPPNATAPPNDT